MRPALLRHVAGWRAAGDRRDPRPSVVCWRAVPSGAEITHFRTASAVLILHRRGCDPVTSGLIVKRQALAGACHFLFAKHLPFMTMQSAIQTGNAMRQVLR